MGRRGSKKGKPEEQEDSGDTTEPIPRGEATEPHPHPRPQKVAERSPTVGGGLEESAAAEPRSCADQERSLRVAVQRGTVGEVRALLRAEVNVDAADPIDGFTALIVAACHGRADIVAALLYYGASTAHADGRGLTALHWAATFGHLGCVQELLSRHADPNVTTRRFDTPLHLACKGLHTQCVVALVGAGADPHCANLIGETARDAVPAVSAHSETSERGARARELRGKIDEMLRPRTIKQSPLRVLLSHRLDEAGPRELVQQLHLALERRGFAVELSELTALPAELRADSSPAAEHTKVECCLAKLCELVGRSMGEELVDSVLRTIEPACLACFIHALALGGIPSASRLPRRALRAPSLALAAVTMEWLRRIAAHADITMSIAAKEAFRKGMSIAAKEAFRKGTARHPSLWMIPDVEDAFIPVGCWDLHYPTDLDGPADWSEAQPNVVLQYLHGDITIDRLQEMLLAETVHAAAERIQADNGLLSSKAILALLSASCKLSDADPVHISGSVALNLLMASLSTSSLAALANLTSQHETNSKAVPFVAANVTQEVHRRISRELGGMRQVPESNAATDESQHLLRATISPEISAALGSPLQAVENEDSLSAHLSRLDMQAYLDRLVALGVDSVDDLDLLTILEDADLQELGISRTQRDSLVSSVAVRVKDLQRDTGARDLLAGSADDQHSELIPESEAHRPASNLSETYQATAEKEASVRSGGCDTSVVGDARDLATQIAPGTGVALVDGLSDGALVNVGSTLDAQILRATLELIEDDRLSNLLKSCVDHDTPAHRAVGNEAANQMVLRLCHLHSISSTLKGDGDPSGEFRTAVLASLRGLSEEAVIDLVGAAVSRAQREARLEARRKEMRSSLRLPDDSIVRTGVGTYPVAISELEQLVIEDLDRRESEHISTVAASSAPAGQESQIGSAEQTQDYRAPDPEPAPEHVGVVTGLGFAMSASETVWRLLDVGSRIFGCDAVVCVVDSQTFGMTHQQSRAFGESLTDSGIKLVTQCELACCAAQNKPVVPILHRLKDLPKHLPSALSNRQCSASFRGYVGQMRETNVVTKIAADAIAEEIHATIALVGKGQSQWDNNSSLAVGVSWNVSPIKQKYPDEPPAEDCAVDKTEVLRDHEPRSLELAYEAESEPLPSTATSTQNVHKGLTPVAFPELLLAKVEQQSLQLDVAVKRIAQLEATATRQDAENRRIDVGLARLDSELDRLTSYVHISAGAGFHSDVRQYEYRPQQQQAWDNATVSANNTAARSSTIVAATSTDVQALANRVEELSATFAGALSKLSAAAAGEELEPLKPEQPSLTPEVVWQVEDPTDSKLVTYSNLESAAITEAWLSGQKKLRLFPTEEAPSRPAVEIELSDMTEKNLEPGASRRTVLGRCDGDLIRFRDAPDPMPNDTHNDGLNGCWVPSSASRTARRMGAIVWEVQREEHGWWAEIKPSHQRRLSAAYLAKITAPVLLDGGAYAADFVKMQWTISSQQKQQHNESVVGEEDATTEKAVRFNPRLRGKVGTEPVPKLVPGADRMDTKVSAEAEQHAHLTAQLARKLSDGRASSTRAIEEAAAREAAMMQRVEKMITDALQTERLERHRMEREQSEARRDQEKHIELRQELAAREVATRTIQRYVRGWSGRAYAARVSRRRTRTAGAPRKVPDPTPEAFEPEPRPSRSAPSSHRVAEASKHTKPANRQPPENYDKMKEKSLQEACRKRGLTTRGTKKDLAERLKEYDKG